MDSVCHACCYCRLASGSEKIVSLKFESATSDVLAPEALAFAAGPLRVRRELAEDMMGAKRASAPLSSGLAHQFPLALVGTADFGVVFLPSQNISNY